MNNFKSYLSLYNQLTDSIDPAKLNKFICAIDSFHTYRTNTLYLCGNGGSYSTAQHFAQDLVKIGKINAYCLGSNISQLTAYANDEGYANIFLSELMTKNLYVGDNLLIISCSGNSKNLIKVAKFMQKLNYPVLGLLGCDGGEVLQYCRDAIVIPAKRFDFIESIHSLLCHYIVKSISE